MEIPCASCGSGTGYDSETPVELRERTYIETVGQLCDPCYERVSADVERIDRIIANEEAKKYNLIPLESGTHYQSSVCPDCFERAKPIGVLLDFLVYKCEHCVKLFRDE